MEKRSKAGSTSATSRSRAGRVDATFLAGLAMSRVRRALVHFDVLRREQMIADQVAYREAGHQGCTWEP